MITIKIKYAFTPLFVATALLWGCSGDTAECSGVNTEPGGDARGAISFRASKEGAAEVTTRAVDDFPNKTIGVTATYTTSVTDWTRFEDINNEAAEVTGESAGVFSFTWRPLPDTVKYWPFDGAGLLFAAYSPHTSESNAVTLYNDLTHLGIQIGEDTPDVMYATGNGRKAWSKEDNVINGNYEDVEVDLGTFNHALSQLRIVVAGDENSFNPGIRIGSLRVKTSRSYGVLDLLGEVDDNMALVVAPDFTYNLVSGSQAFTAQNPYSSSVYLFPGTEEQTEITVTFIDGTFTYTVTFVLSDVLADKENDGDPDVYLTLQRAKITTVRFVVKSTSVQNPEDGVQIQGTLSEWKPMGDLTVTIN